MSPTDIVLEASIVRQPTGGIVLTVNGTRFEFTTLAEAYWMLREAADQQRQKLADQQR